MPSRRPLLLLALGAFAIGTDTFVISGVLPDVARDLGVSLSRAGLLVTAFALAYAVGAPVLATLTGRVERRRLLAVVLGTFAAANVLSAVAPSYGVLLPARLLAAGSAALYMPSAPVSPRASSSPSSAAARWPPSSAASRSPTPRACRSARWWAAA